MDTGSFESTLQRVSTVLSGVVHGVQSAGDFVGRVLGGGSAGQYGMTEADRYAGDPTYLPGVCLSNGHSANNFNDT
jgi:hypothetical protein